MGVPALGLRMEMGAGFRATGAAVAAGTGTGTGPFGAFMVLMATVVAGGGGWTGFSTSIWLGEHIRQVQLL